MGNFNRLTRSRYFTTETTDTLYDDYNYDYAGGSNRLAAVDNTTDNSLDRSYTYDGNGNMLNDDYRNVTFGSMLRGVLPTGFTKTDNQQQMLYAIDYHYDVNDQRVAKTDPEEG